MYRKISFKNKFRIIEIPLRSTRAVTVLVLVGAGSKYEKKENNGISHFLEHMFFKGTKKRPTPLSVAEELDKVGGIYNAFTDKEFTGYWAKVESPHLDLALDWVSDIFLNSKIEKKELNKERGVIIQEMNMYLDMPQVYIGDLWEKLLYGDQPAGWLIIGNKKNILKFQRKDLLNYLKNHYSSQNTVLCIAGNIKGSTKNKVRRYFQKIKNFQPQDKPKVLEKQKSPQSLVFFKKTDQTHLSLGVRGYSLSSPLRFVQEVMAAILGGFMSSRIFSSVREKRGLAYYVRTKSGFYTDTGYLVTQAGVDHEKAEETVKIILKEYRRIRDKKIGKKELKKAKDYLKGTLALSLESSDAIASFYATQELLLGKIMKPEEVFAKIEKVTPEDVQRVAKEIFRPEKLNLALIGPFKKKKVFEKILKF